MISLFIGIILIKMVILYSLKSYNLTNGVPKNLINIKESTDLSFYIRATEYQKATITITMNNNVSPFTSIITCSYKSLNSNCESKMDRWYFLRKKEIN